MGLKMNIQKLEQSINQFQEEVNSLKGKIQLLEEQYTFSEQKLIELKELQEVNQKSVELLNLIQKATKELIQQMFENIVTKALQYVYQTNDYKFELEFGRHGNIPTLNFLVKTPDLKESHDIIDSRGGGHCDVISLALRLVLLEVSRMPGFLFLDEPDKFLDSPETLKKMIDFILETQKETKRQIFIITHKQELVDAVPDPIILKEVVSDNKVKDAKSETNEHSPEVNNTPIKRGRGRPKKVSST